jgi:LysM repeat protein
MSKTRTLPVLLLIVALTVPATLFGQVSYEVSNQKVLLGGQTYYIHLVLKDQTLYSIAQTYKVSIDAITRNNAIPPNGIQTDQVLRIPESAALAATMPKPKPPTPVAPVQEPQPKAQPERQTPPPASVTAAKENKPAEPPAKPESDSYRMHKVKKGETLYSISRDYSVTVEAIIRVNDVPRNEIQTGQMLKIPPSDYVTFVKEEPTAAAASANEAGAAEASKKEVKATEASPTEAPQAQPQTAAKVPEKQQAQPEAKKYHKVKKGESLSDIAQKYNVSVREIKDANDGLLFPMPGMKLLIPVKKGEEADKVIKE